MTARPRERPPGARGLFAAAMVDSGTYALTSQPLAAAEASGAAFAAKVGCTRNVAACLRALPAAKVVDHEVFTGYRPDVDGRVLTQSIGPALRAGDFSRVPVVIGINHDEWRLFVAMNTLKGEPVTTASYQPMIAATLGVPVAAAAAIAARYPLSGYPARGRHGGKGQLTYAGRRGRPIALDPTT